MTVLLVGDFLVDRTWLVGKPAQEERFSAHYDVLPKVLDPSRKTDVAGGIATTARVLSANGIDVTVVGAWGKDAQPETMVPLPPLVDGTYGKIDWVHAGSPTHPPTITRIFAFNASSKRPRLIERFDQGTPISGNDRNFTWPSKTPNLVVAGEYLKDESECILLDTRVTERLYEYSRAGVPILLRSIRFDVVKKLPWTLLSVNVHHLNEILVTHETVGKKFFQGQAVRVANGSCVFHPGLLKAIQAFRSHFLNENSPNRFVLLNLEREGALLVDREMISPLLLGVSLEGHPGLWATDVLLGNVAKGMVLARKDWNDLTRDRDDILRICKEALGIATTFSRSALDLESIDGWYAPQIFTSNPAAIEVKNSTSLQKLLKDDEQSKTYEHLMNNGIELHRASWYLQDYLTADEGFGGEIVRLKRQIVDYLNAPGRRPFVAAICGEPGAGKSALAEGLRKVTNCEFISENAAQWTSPDDLSWLLERVRSLHVRGKACLVLIDEVDSKPGGQRLYAKLLAPLWDNSYFIRGDERAIGSPTVFLLAGSTKEWQNAEALLDGFEGEILGNSMEGKDHTDKLRDLVSRFTVPPVTIPALKDRKIDIAYLATHGILRQSPRVKRVQRGVFSLLAESSGIRHGVRSITRVVELFAFLKDEDQVTTSDLSDPSMLKLHIPNPKEGWEMERDFVVVKP